MGTLFSLNLQKVKMALDSLWENYSKEVQMLKMLGHIIYICESHSVVSNSLWPHGLYSSWNSPSQDTGVGCLSRLQGISPTHGLDPGLPHCRRILYQQSHRESPRILEWVAYPFSRGSSRPRNQTGVSCIASRFFTNWAIREAQATRKRSRLPVFSAQEESPCVPVACTAENPSSLCLWDPQ